MQWLDSIADSLATRVVPKESQGTAEEEEEARLEDSENHEKSVSSASSSTWGSWIDTERMKALYQRTETAPDGEKGGNEGNGSETTSKEQDPALTGSAWGSWIDTGKMKTLYQSTVDSVAIKTGELGRRLEDIMEDVVYPEPSSNEPRSDEPLPPWVCEGPDKDKQDVLRRQILNLSHEKFHFLEKPSIELLNGFHFDMEESSACAMMCLRLDEQLEKMRWILVPWKVSEKLFWENYFAHIFVLRMTLLTSKLEVDERIKAESADPVAKRNMELIDLKFLDEIDSSRGPGNNEEGEVVELSSLSIDGMSLEDQINLALLDEE